MRSKNAVAAFDGSFRLFSLIKSMTRSKMHSHRPTSENWVSHFMLRIAVGRDKYLYSGSAYNCGAYEAAKD